MLSFADMNYLGHAFLSFGQEPILLGNMIGDYIKGKKALEDYEPSIRKGLMLHRKIDTYTDSHPAFIRAKHFFREDYGLYAGAVTDIVMDHFLANDPKHFASEQALLEFTETTYQQLSRHQTFYPEPFCLMFPYMSSQNWLYHYRTLKGIEKSLNGLYKRAQKMPPTLAAYQTFVSNYYQLNQCYFEFMDDMVSYVKIELTESLNS